MKRTVKILMYISLAMTLALAGAVHAGIIDVPTAGAMLLIADTVPVMELKAMQKAFDDAMAAIKENVKKTQDVADQALAESKKFGGVIEAKTNDVLVKLGETGTKLADDLKALRDMHMGLEQKVAAKIADPDPARQKSMFETIRDSDQYKKAGTEGKMHPVVIGSFHKHWDTLTWEQKTQIINASGQNQPLVPAQRVPGIITPAQQRLFIRDLIPAAVTDSNLIEFASEATFTSAAAPQGGGSPGNAEGELKAEAAMTFALATAPVVTLAHWIPASRQVLSDAKMLQGHVSGRLMYGLKLEEEAELLRGTGAAGTINGLTNQATAYNRGVTNDTILDTLLKAMLQVSLSNYEASAYVLNPIDWVGAMLLKDTQGRYLFSNPQDMVAPRVWSKPVVATQSMTLGKFLCGAFDLAAQIWDKEDATVRISENVNDHFIRNLVAILAEERLALTVYRSTAMVYGNTSHAG